ncbi:MAG: hypothetical protein E7311_03180 [Clostridiales bacterium]|nr:hypothetical protein [Clostridiales bacterium]
MSKFINKVKEYYKQTKRKSLLVYLILRILVIICMILQLLRGDWNNAFLCLLSLLLFTIPMFLQYRFKIKIPILLESIVYIFIFSAEILGEINNFYGIIPYWDTILHTINGFLCAGIGFSLVDLLNENSRNINLSPVFVAIVAFCFSMTIGVLWEFFEYGADIYLKYDMQKDTLSSSISSVTIHPNNKNKAVIVDNITYTNIYTENEVITINGGYLDIGIHDTMKDLFVNFIGALSFSTIGYLYIKNRDKYKFATNFIVTK